VPSCAVAFLSELYSRYLTGADEIRSKTTCENDSPNKYL